MIDNKTKLTASTMAAVLAASGAMTVAGSVPAFAASDDDTQESGAEITGEYVEPNEDGSKIDINGDMKAESADEFSEWLDEQTAALDEVPTFLYNENPSSIVTGVGKTVTVNATVGNANGDTLGVNEWTLMNDKCADQFEITEAEDGQSIQVRPLIKGSTAFIKHTWTYVDTVHTEIFVVSAGEEGDRDLADSFDFDKDVVAHDADNDKVYNQDDVITMNTGDEITLTFEGIDKSLMPGGGSTSSTENMEITTTNGDYVNAAVTWGKTDSEGNTVPAVTLKALKVGKTQVQLCVFDKITADSTVYTFDIDVNRATADDEEMDADFYVATDFSYDENGAVAASDDGHYQEVGTGTVMMDPEYGTTSLADGQPIESMGMLYKDEIAPSINEDGTVNAELGDIEYDGKTLTYAKDANDFINTYTVDWEAMAVNAAGAMVDAAFGSSADEDTAAEEGTSATTESKTTDQENDGSGEEETGSDDATIKMIGTAYLSVLGNDVDVSGTPTPIAAFDGAYDGMAHTPDAITFDEGATDIEYSVDGVNWSSDINTVAQTEIGSYTGYARATTAPNVKTVYQYTMNINDVPAPAAIPADTTALPQTGDAGVVGIAAVAAVAAVSGGVAAARRRRLRR